MRRFTGLVAVALSCAVSAAALAASPPAAQSTPLTQDQSKAVEQLIHDYLMNNPKVLAEALAHADDVAKEEQATAAKTAIVAHRDELERDPASPVMGNPSGDVTVVEFFDYRCPYCKASEASVEALLQHDKQVRLVLKEYPILGADSIFASRVALVAQKHGKYAEFHRGMFALAQKPTEEATLGVAKSIGLDPAQVKKEAEGSDIDAVLKQNIELAKTLGIDGTPTFYVGTTTVPGAIEPADLQNIVTATRKGQS